LNQTVANQHHKIVLCEALTTKSTSHMKLFSAFRLPGDKVVKHTQEGGVVSKGHANRSPQHTSLATCEWRESITCQPHFLSLPTCLLWLWNHQQPETRALLLHLSWWWVRQSRQALGVGNRGGKGGLRPFRPRPFLLHTEVQLCRLSCCLSTDSRSFLPGLYLSRS